MNTLDWVLVGVTVLFAIAGWRQGLIRGAFSMVGFVAGALLATAVLPSLLSNWNTSVLMRGLVSVLGVVGLALIGQALTGWVGRRLRDNWTWKPAEVVDSLCGAAFYVLALAAVVWVLASALALLPESTVWSQVASSRVVAGLDQVVPGPARRAVWGLQQLLDSSGFPRVFDTIIEPPSLPVAPPDPAVLATPAVRRAKASLVRIQGVAEACSEQITGSGFVYAPNRVMTNAHVVAGVTDPEVQVDGTGRKYAARVVYFDPTVDVAVLDVPDLNAPSLTFAPDATRGTEAVVAGFPGGGPLDAEPARVRARLSARGQDIQGGGSVVRDIYAVRSRVRPGNSGGPLLSVDGAVYGVVFAAAVHDPGTGYVLTASEVSTAADSGRAATTEVASGSCVSETGH